MASNLPRYFYISGTTLYGPHLGFKTCYLDLHLYTFLRLVFSRSIIKKLSLFLFLFTFIPSIFREHIIVPIRRQYPSYIGRRCLNIQTSAHLNIRIIAKPMFDIQTLECSNIGIFKHWSSNIRAYVWTPMVSMVAKVGFFSVAEVPRNWYDYPIPYLSYFVDASIRLNGTIANELA